MFRNPKLASACSGSAKRAWSFTARFSMERVSSETLQDSRQLLLTHVPYILNETSVLKALIVTLTRFRLSCMFWPPKLGSENRLCEIMSLNSNVQRQRILNAHIQKIMLGRVQLTVGVKQACNPQPFDPSITIELSVHLDFRNSLHAISIPLSVVRWRLTMCSYHCSILLSTPTLIAVTIVAVRLTMNMWLNSVQPTRYLAQNQKVSEYSWPIC